MRAYNETKYIDTLSSRMASEFFTHKKISSLSDSLNEEDYSAALDELVQFARFMLRSNAFVHKRPTLTDVHKAVFHEGLSTRSLRTIFVKVARSLSYKNKEIAKYINLDPSTVSYHYNIEDLWIEERVIEILNTLKQSLILQR